LKKIPVNKEIILSRLEEIRKDLSELESFKNMDEREFRKGRNFPAAEHFLRRAIEAVFDAGSHVLSRIPGARAATYRDVAERLGKYGIVPEKFSNEKLVKMAGYRNRLTHFYMEVREDELLQIIKNNLSDIEEFAKYIKKVLAEPEKFNLPD
jgi:uncharacterized protein YutE (UPF0331/DUF86 family)